MDKGLLSLGSSLRLPSESGKSVPPLKGGLFNRLSGTSLQSLKIPKRYIISFLGYAFYAIILFVLFLYLTFPYQKLEARLIAMLEQAFSCQIKVAEARWLFPLGLSWKEVRLAPEKGFRGDVVVDQARAKIYLLPLLHKNIEGDFFLEAFGGKIRGTLLIQRKDGKARYYFQESARDLELQSMGLDLPFALEGRVRLDLEASWEDQNLMQGQGSGSLEFLNVRAREISAIGWEVPELSFVRVAAKLGFKNGVLNMEGFSAEGPHIEATGQGTLLLRTRWSEGLLNLATKTYFKEDLRQKIPVLAMIGNQREAVEVLIKGTLARPMISINGVPLNL